MNFNIVSEPWHPPWNPHFRCIGLSLESNLFLTFFLFSKHYSHSLWNSIHHSPSIFVHSINCCDSSIFDRWRSILVTQESDLDLSLNRLVFFKFVFSVVLWSVVDLARCFHHHLGLHFFFWSGMCSIWFVFALVRLIWFVSFFLLNQVFRISHF